jgi:hypothetical protein
MVDKTSGEIAYAVLSFGEFLGIGNERYPVSWKVLRYDPILAATSMTGRSDEQSWTSTTTVIRPSLIDGVR